MVLPGCPVLVTVTVLLYRRVSPSRDSSACSTHHPPVQVTARSGNGDRATT